jgi:hypothetical protein
MFTPFFLIIESYLQRETITIRDPVPNDDYNNNQIFSSLVSIQNYSFLLARQLFV